MIIKMIKEKGNFDEIVVPSTIILPNSVNKTRWDIWIIILVLYNVFFTPLDIGFVITMPTYWIFVDYIIDFMFFLDIIFTFRTALIDQYGRINPNSWDIASSYLRNWFMIDLLASLPLTILSGVIGKHFIFPTSNT
jgi:hypothetical protein